MEEVIAGVWTNAKPSSDTGCAGAPGSVAPLDSTTRGLKGRVTPNLESPAIRVAPLDSMRMGLKEDLDGMTISALVAARCPLAP